MAADAYTMTSPDEAPGGEVEIARDQPRRGRGLVGNVVGRVVPAVMRRVDTDELLEYVDVNAVAEQLDLDALVTRLDVNALAERLDLDALVARLDVDGVASRLDLDALVERLDVDHLAARLDLDALVARLDVDGVASRLDLDALVERMDVDAVASRVDMAKLTADATQDVAFSGLDLARRQLVRADATVDGVVGRLVRRGRDNRPIAPTQLQASSRDEPEREPVGAQRRTISGHYAGAVTRVAALAGDIFGSLGTFGLFGGMTLYLLGVFTPVDPTISSGGWITVGLSAVWFLIWFWLPVALFGRTLAMAVAGIAVVSRNGATAGPLAGFLRALAMPFSVGFLAVGLLGIVIGREHRALHDVVAGTAVVYDWGEREAEQPATVRELLTARVNRRRAARDRSTTS